MDDNPSNGITIPVTVTSSLSQIEETSISDIETEDELLTINNELSSEIDEDFDGVIDVDDAQAETVILERVKTVGSHGNKTRRTTEIMETMKMTTTTSSSEDRK